MEWGVRVEKQSPNPDLTSTCAAFNIKKPHRIGSGTGFEVAKGPGIEAGDGPALGARRR